MPKADMIEVEGIVRDVLRGTKFKVELENGGQILATLSGKMRSNFIRIAAGDRVMLRISPYDLTKGFIVWRFK